MGVLPANTAREAASRAYEELEIPVGSPPELVVATFRTLCLQHAFRLGDPPSSAATHKAKKDPTDNNQTDDDLFQRQSVAYRFLRSLPLLENTEYRSDAILAKLRPLEQPHSHKLSGDRASAMLDVSISTLEHAQRRWQLPYINYVITVHYCLRKHVVRRRYSEFQALHEVLQRRLPVIPALPERSWLLKLRVPLERAQSLAQYLLRVVAILSMRGVFSQEIMAFLEIDFARVRAEEEALALEFLSRASPTGSRRDRQRLFYLVTTEWLSEWKRFITDPSHHAPPGAITNRKLLIADEVPVLGRDYRCLNFVSWQYVSQIYGGGPRIVRSVPTIQGDDAVDTHTIAVILQRLARGFLGRRAAQKRRLDVLRQDPLFAKRLNTLQRHACLDACMDTVRKFVSAREFQIRHIASIKIQRAVRRFLLRLEHKLLLAESAVPAVGENFQHVEEYFSLEEIGLIRDASHRLAHFLVTMNKGVPIQKLRSRRKMPQWRLFRIDAIGSQLLWSSKKSDHALAFSDVTTLVVESPLLLKSGFGRRRSTTYDHAVVLAYKDASATATKGTTKAAEATAKSELILICESQCDCDALRFGLNALLTETRNRTANGATYVDGHGVLRKKLPHAKRLIHDAQQLIDTQLHNPFRLNQQQNPFL